MTGRRGRSEGSGRVAGVARQAVSWMGWMGSIGSMGRDGRVFLQTKASSTSDSSSDVRRAVRWTTPTAPNKPSRDVTTHGVGSGFGKWMQEAHSEAFTSAFKRVNGGEGSSVGSNGSSPSSGNGSYDHVYIDVNNVLHVAAHHTKNEDAFFKKLFALLDLNMRRTKPQYTVVLALDGPAPIAKTITQRRRRIRLSSGEKVPLSEDPPRLLKIGLTPGSALALKIDRALEYYAATRLLSRNALPKGLLFEISGTRVPGEGEVKILRSMKARVSNPKFKNHSHLIVSEDSDALLLAMTAAPADVFVLSSKLVFSVQAFNESLKKDLPSSMTDTQLISARRDFVALAVMMGNDYLPGSRFGVKYSWRAYAKLRSENFEAPDWRLESERGQRTNGRRVSGGRGRERGRMQTGWDYGADESSSSASTVSSTNGVSEFPHQVMNYCEDVGWGKYRDAPLFPVPGESDFGGPSASNRRAARFFGADVSGTAAVYEDGKLAFRHPPPVNWQMLRDFAKVLSDPEYVKWQVSGGLRPRADVQRAVNAAAASVHTPSPTGKTWKTFDEDDKTEDSREERSAENKNTGENAEELPLLREGTFSTIPGVAGVVRAKLDPKRSARRAYEYVHGVGWVLEMYYSGACLDYGYHFQYSSKEHNQGIAATIGGNGSDGVNAGGALARAADDAAIAAATAAVANAAAAAQAAAGTVNNEKKNTNSTSSSTQGVQKPPHMGGRSTHPPPAVDLADFQQLPDTYDPTLDPLRDRGRAKIAYLNRYPITPLAYSLAVIPRGGRAMLAKGVRPLVDAGSPTHHLFCDDYCVTCIKHRIAAGPLERVIQQESGNGGINGGGNGGQGRGRGGKNGGRGRGRGRGKTSTTTGTGRDLSRKIAGGDATIREAAEAGGEVAREVLRKLNRRHLDHLSRAPQHATDKPPPPLNDLEGAVARLALDDGLNADEETLRTLGDEPVLIWHHRNNDPPDLDLMSDDALTRDEDIPEWATRVAPPGCRPVGRQMHEIRRYDGDAAPVISKWAVGGEAPAVASGPGGGPQRMGKQAQTNRSAGGTKKKRGRGGAAPTSKEGINSSNEGSTSVPSERKPVKVAARAAPKPKLGKELSPQKPKSAFKPKPKSNDVTSSAARTDVTRGGRVHAYVGVSRTSGMSAKHFSARSIIAARFAFV